MRTDSPNADTRWACNRKKAYPTEEVAGKVAKKINGRDPTADVVPYGCGHCGRWHVGRRLRESE